MPILFLLLSLTVQRDTTARLVGTATSTFNGLPIAGVMIAAPDAGKFVVTDSTGAFDLAGLPAGPQVIRIAYQGRETEEYTFHLRRGSTKRLAVMIDADAYDLAPVVVEARFPDAWRDLAGFYERRKLYGGFGRFFTREDIERGHPRSISVVLARAGVANRCLTYECVPTIVLRGRVCPLQVSVDGTPFWEYEYDDIPVDEVAAIEVHRGVIPIELGSIPRGRGECGTIQIWTKD